MDKRYKTFDTQIQVDDAARCMTFIISTGTVDRDGDVIDPKGWQFANYLKNPVVLFGHDYYGLPVAKTTDLSVVDGNVIAKTEFPAKGTYDFADTCYDMLKGGFLNATSVGFQPLLHEEAKDRKGYNITKQELLEFSIVPIPSNPDALVSQRGVTNEQVHAWKKALLDWAAPQPTRAMARLTALGINPEACTANRPAWEAFEKDYAVEAESADLPPARIVKLLTLHGFTEQASALMPKAPSARAMYGKSMDAAESAGKAMDACDHCLGSKTISNEQKAKVKEARGHAADAQASAMEAADLCHQQMTGKEATVVIHVEGKVLAEYVEKLTKPLPLPTEGESEQDFIHRCMGNEHIQHDFETNEQRVAVCYGQWQRHQKRDGATQTAMKDDEAAWLELDDDDLDVEDEFDVDEKALAIIIKHSLAEAVGDSVRASILKATGRLPD